LEALPLSTPMAHDSPIKRMTVSRQIDGVSLNSGIGLGRAIIHQPAGMKATGVEIQGQDTSIKSELLNLDQAFIHLVDEIQMLIPQTESSFLPKNLTQSQAKSQADARDIFDVHLMMANDPGWKRQLRQRIHAGMTAAVAIDQTLNSIRETFKGEGMQSHWYERISDFEDLSSRLKRHLAGFNIPGILVDESAIIVVADRIGPAELLDYDRSRLTGLILVEQSQTSHVAIVARSLAIPVVGGMKNILQEIKPGDSLLVDGNEGRVYIRPVSEVISRYDAQVPFKKIRHVEPSSQTAAHLPTKTLDDVAISLLLNAGLVEDVNHIETAGAEGIGLYRTEIPFMMRPRLPNVNEQVKLYQEILKRAGRYPVVFRTLDVGGDKVLPYLERLKSEGPVKKGRAENIVFDRPILLRYQLRALIRASAGTELTIMLPMIAEVSEVQAARELLDNEVNRQKDKGNAVPTKIRLGAMIEVPSLVYQLPQLFPHVDFLSVGSNDLFQFFYAIDREYPKLTARYDVLSPTFLSMLKFIQNQCEGAKVPLSICGEMAGRPLEALALIGLGYRILSMSAAAIPPIKNMIQSLSYQEISDYMGTVCVPSHPNIRQSLHDFAKGHEIYCE
jgi:phosphotransferase system enzyme I (PtsP)